MTLDHRLKSPKPHGVLCVESLFLDIEPAAKWLKGCQIVAQMDAAGDKLGHRAPNNNARHRVTCRQQAYHKAGVSSATQLVPTILNSDRYLWLRAKSMHTV